MYSNSSGHHEILSATTSLISEVVINKLKELNKIFSPEILERIGAVQGMLGDIPVLAFPMEEDSWHCVNYMRYPKEPRFYNATTKRNRKIKLSPLGLKTLDSSLDEIFLVEGIWDLLTMLDADLNTLALPGVNNFKDEWIPFFGNKKVNILFDNDVPGQKYAGLHSRRILTAASEVRILELKTSLKHQKQIYKIKDISDVLAVDKIKGKQLIIDLVNSTPPSTISLHERIDEIITGPGNNINKSYIITQLINSDIESKGGTILPHNNHQEMAIIFKGLLILTGDKIDMFLGRQYGFIPSDAMWRYIRDRLYNIALQKDNISIYGYSYWNGDKLFIGTNRNGIICITSKYITSHLQGYGDIYIKSGNNFTTDDIETFTTDIAFDDDSAKWKSFEDLLDIFDYSTDTLSERAQKFLLKVWFYYTFFGAQIKPALCIVGSPGSGKTLLQKILKGLLFTFKNGQCNPNSMPEEDYTLTTMLKEYVYLFLDEVNESDAKLKTKIRMLVTGEETVFRPKYARNTIRFSPKIWLVLSSHSPKFRDLDISQRLSIIHLVKPHHKKLLSENVFLAYLEEHRVILWKDIFNNLQQIIFNLKNHDQEQMPLKHYCRQTELANFAWRAFPEQRDVCSELFNNMDRQQSHFSAEFDPIVDILDQFIEGQGLQYINGDGRIKVTAKQLYNGLLPRVKEVGMKSFPVSIAGFARWIQSRSGILKDQFGYDRELDTTKNTYHYYFKAPEKETF